MRRSWAKETVARCVTRAKDTAAAAGIVPHEGHLAVTDLGELVALLACGSPALGDLPRRAIVGIGGHIDISYQTQRISLQPQNPCLRRGRLPADNLRHPCTSVLGVLALLPQVGLPETIQKRLREPCDQGAAGLCRCAEERSTDLGLEEVLPIQLRVAEVSVRIAVRELEARQGLGQMRGEMCQLRKVEHELRYRRRVAIPPQCLLKAVRLRRNIVDDDDLSWFFIVGRGPSPVALIVSALVDCRLDQAAGAGKRFKMAVDADPIVGKSRPSNPSGALRGRSGGAFRILVSEKSLTLA